MGTAFDNTEKNHILDTRQCKTIMTVSDDKGKQIIRDTNQKCFLQDFRKMFIQSYASWRQSKVGNFYFQTVVEAMYQTFPVVLQRKTK
jgi:hypothetical protein